MSPPYYALGHNKTIILRLNNKRRVHCTYVIGLDDARVVTMHVESETIELLESARHPTVTSDQPVSEQVLVNARIGEVTVQQFVVQRVIAQRRRVRVQVRIRQVKIEILLRPPWLHAVYITHVVSKDCPN